MPGPGRNPPAGGAKAGAAAAHQHGHRQRLRERFLTGGAGAMPDYELLELLLCLARPRGDVKPLAKELIDRFGNFAEVISARQQDLCKVDGVGETTVAALKTVQAAALRLQAQSLRKRSVISSWRQLLDYCHSAMAREPVEQLRLLYLDRKNVLIADEVQQQGTIDQTPVFTREVVKRGLELGASALILVHNHPSGDTTPSRADIQITREVVAAARTVGITVHDHVIVGRHGHTSFRADGLL